MSGIRLSRAGYPDHRHEVVGLRRLRKYDRCRRRLATYLIDAQEGEIRAFRVLDVEDLSEFEGQAVLAIDLLKEIDRGAHGVSIQALSEDKPRAALATELGSHVPIGHDGLGGDKPTRPEPRKGVSHHFDPANRPGRMHQLRARRHEP